MDEIKTVESSEWRKLEHDSSWVSRDIVGKSSDGWHGGFETSYQGGEKSINWSEAIESKEEAKKVAIHMDNNWRLPDETREERNARESVKNSEREAPTPTPSKQVETNRIQFAEVEREKSADYLRSYIERNQVKPQERMTVTFERTTVNKVPDAQLTVHKIFERHTNAEKAASPQFEKGVKGMEEAGFRLSGVSHGGPPLSKGPEQDRFGKDLQQAYSHGR